MTDYIALVKALNLGVKDDLIFKADCIYIKKGAFSGEVPYLTIEEIVRKVNDSESEDKAHFVAIPGQQGREEAKGTGL